MENDEKTIYNEEKEEMNKEELKKEKMENMDKKEMNYEHRDRMRHMGHMGSFGVLLWLLGTILIVGGLISIGMMAFNHDRIGIDRRNVQIGAPMMLNYGERGYGYGGMMGGRINENNYAVRSGVTGQITVINGNNLTVKDSTGTEKTVVVSDTTSYVKANDIAKQSDLQVNNVISAVGTSNSQSQIVATTVQIW